MCIFMTAIGKIYGDASLQDLLIESGISTEGRIDKHYMESATIMHVQPFMCLRKFIPSKDQRI